MPREFSRGDRVRKAMIREVADAIQSEVKDPLLADKIVSVTDVDLAKDFSHAKVFVSILGSEEDKEAIMELLEEYAPKIRTAVGKKLRLRYTTKLVFCFDDSLERGSRVNELLKKIANEDL